MEFINMENIKEIDRNLFEELNKSAQWNKKRIRYGTSGFRFHNEVLPFVSFRVGLFAGLLSKKFYPESMGTVFTASHN